MLHYTSTSYTSWVTLGRQLQMSLLCYTMNCLRIVCILWISFAMGTSHSELYTHCELCRNWIVYAAHTVNCKFIKWRSSCPPECVGFVSFINVGALTIQHHNMKVFQNIESKGSVGHKLVSETKLQVNMDKSHNTRWCDMILKGTQNWVAQWAEVLDKLLLYG